LNGNRAGFIISGMSEETTHNLPDGRSFEERVFARFDAFDARFDVVDASLRDLNARVQRLESESERRAADTKPIWERALAEIVAVGEKVDALTERVEKVEHKLDVFWEDMLMLRSQQRQLGKRMDKLESKPAS
jgi:chromosome segregation ATPase